MAKRKKQPPSDVVDAFAGEDATPGEKPDIENWADQEEHDAFVDAKEYYTTVRKAWDNKEDQDNNIEEFWNIFNCKVDDNAQYSGNATCYIPAVRDAVNARTKRALKQLFPANNKHVEAVSSDHKTPWTQLSLLEHYIRQTRLKSIVRTVLVAGDVTGQWNVMVDWTKSKRRTTQLVESNSLEMDGEELDVEGILDQDEETEEVEVTDEGPEIVDFATQDLVVIPPTCQDLQKAQAVGVKLRLSREKVKMMVDEGVIILPENTDIKEFCIPDKERDKKNPKKKAAGDAGIKTDGTDKHALIYMVYMKLPLDGKGKPKCPAIIFYSGKDEVCGIIRNPLWSGKIPIVSEPVERNQGSFFGISKIEPVKFLQWNLNDFFNMGQDSAMYSLLPIWAVNPQAAPQWASLVMGLAAVWPVGPNDVKPLTQPQLWKESMQITDAMKRQIWESMDVNDMMMGKMPQGRKNNQLMGAMQQEQQVNITDHASRFEDVVLNPLLELLFEFDQQYRTDEVTIEQRGEIGEKAALEVIPPPQWGEKYFFRWNGTEAMQTMQRIQQQIAAVNVLKGIPPQMLNGRTLDVGPFAEMLAETAFGPEIAPRILLDQRNQFKMDPVIENEMLWNGFEVDVHEADDDPAHLQSHMQAAAMSGDPVGYFKTHMQKHMAQLQKKREMAMGPTPQQGLPGAPGGAGPGVPGTPRPGAMPAPGGPRPAQNPPGAIQADAMPGMPGRG